MLGIAMASLYKRSMPFFQILDSHVLCHPTVPLNTSLFVMQP